MGPINPPHRNNKCQAPGFCSALHAKYIGAAANSEYNNYSADEKQETTTMDHSIMSLGHISLQNSKLFLAQR